MNLFVDDVHDPPIYDKRGLMNKATVHCECAHPRMGHLAGPDPVPWMYIRGAESYEDSKAAKYVAIYALSHDLTELYLGHNNKRSRIECVSGKVDPLEETGCAAMREFREEAGLDLHTLRFHYLGTMPGDESCAIYVVVLRRSDRVRLCPREFASTLRIDLYADDQMFAPYETQVSLVRNNLHHVITRDLWVSDCDLLLR
jgi:ADP-ribose pyrophosphatase YjhB (NUDIX family)